MTSPRAGSPIVTNKLPSPRSGARRVLLVFGTRPEAIKLCPLISALRRRSCLQPVVCVTAQHRHMLDQVLNVFDVSADYDLNMMHPGQTLTALTARMVAALEPVFCEVKPAVTVVQGDTTSTLCGALASFYARVPVAHVEAGLRTFDMRAPFPEEMNRVLAGRLADLHFAATPWAANNLTQESVAPERIHVTGNTGIDAVLAVRDALENGRDSGLNLPIDSRKKLVVVTAHRRESFGAGIADICNAILTLTRREDVQVIWPVHRNPNVHSTVHGTLAGKANVLLTEPLEYVPFIDLLRRAHLLITDSGGVQEEGPSLGKPVLVLREKTERPEAVEAGTVKLVGTDCNKIVREAERLLDDRSEHERMSRLHNPYGDGKACARICGAIAAYLDARAAVAGL